MEKEEQNNQNKSSKYGYTLVSDYFFRELVKVTGTGPGMLYLELLSYCHKKKDIAWPTLNTLSKDLRIAKTTVIRHLNILIKLNFIKNITRDKSNKYQHRNNIYQIIPPEKISLRDFPESKNSELYGSKMKPSGYQNDTCNGSNLKLVKVANCYPNNNNLNNNNITTTKRENAVVAMVNFKKLKKKGEEKMPAIREQLADLDFEGRFIEQLIKDFSLPKIEEKLELLLEKKHIQNPAGWLRAALKNDYQSSEPEEKEEDEKKEKIALKKVSPKKEACSREKALEMIRKTREMLANL